MLRRIKASLANPSSISMFRKDKLGLVLIYIFLLCFIATLPTLIYGIKQDRVSDEAKYEIRIVLVENRDNIIKGNINDNTLTITEKHEGFVIGDEVAILMPSDEIDPVNFVSERIYYVVKLNDHDVQLFFLGNKIKTYTYTELGLDGMDFSFFGEVDYKTRITEFERLESAYDKAYKDIKPMLITINVIAVLFRVLFATIIFALVCALISRGVKGISFKELFVITLYSFVMFVMGQIIDELYGFTLFAYIGIFISFIYYVIALRGITVFKIENK